MTPNEVFFSLLFIMVLCGSIVEVKTNSRLGKLEKKVEKLRDDINNLKNSTHY